MRPVPRLTAIARVSLSLTLACAAPRPPTVPMAPPHQRTDRGDIGSVAVTEGAAPSEFVPEQIYSPGMEVLKSTGHGALVGAYLCALGGDANTGELGAVIFLLCLPVAVPLGALVGTLVSKPNEMQDTFELAARNAIGSVQLEPNLVEAATRYAERSGRTLVDVASASSRLELGVTRIELSRTTGENAILRVGYRARLVRSADSSTLGEYASTLASDVHPIPDWVGADGQGSLLRDSLLHLYGEIAEDAIDEFMLVYAGEPPLVSPPSPLLLEPTTASFASVRPVLRWEAWPWSPNAQPASADSVVYDLRIRSLGERGLDKFVPPASTAPIYESFGMAQPAHELTEDLRVCGWYAVQVRARFPQGEITKATEWVNFGYPLDTIEQFDLCALPFWVR